MWQQDQRTRTHEEHFLTRSKDSKEPGRLQFRTTEKRVRQTRQVDHEEFCGERGALIAQQQTAGKGREKEENVRTTSKPVESGIDNFRNSIRPMEQDKNLTKRRA